MNPIRLGPNISKTAAGDAGHCNLAIIANY